MENNWLTRIAIIAIVIIAFIDGMMVAEKLNEKSSTSASETPSFSDIFDLSFYEEKQTTQQEVPTQLPVQEEEIFPFTTQAPLGDWKSPWADFAEEATAYMAIKWAQGEEFGSPRETSSDFLALGEWEVQKFATSVETTAAQTLEILTNYFGFYNTSLKYNPNLEDLKSLLDQGSVAILPVNGRVLDNPHYGDPAPKHHNILLIGYDETLQQFITNDPGTRYGEGATYSYEKILAAIQDLDGSNVIVVIEN